MHRMDMRTSFLIVELSTTVNLSLVSPKVSEVCHSSSVSMCMGLSRMRQGVPDMVSVPQCRSNRGPRSLTHLKVVATLIAGVGLL